MDPQDVENLFSLIPLKLQKKRDDSPFLIYYDSDVVFASLAGLSRLKKEKTWYCDGIFDIAPLSFAQVYTIHVVNKHKVEKPCVFSLLKS